MKQERYRAGQGSNDSHCTLHESAAGPARKQFTFYRSYYEALAKLPKSQRLGALEAVIGYALDGTEPQRLSDVQQMAFLLIKPTLDAGRKKALAGRLGAAVTNRQRSGKGEIEKENEIEKEKELELETENEDDSPGDDGFAEFWDLYPVKLGKDKAMTIWHRSKPDPQAVCAGLRKWRQSDQWKRDKGRFIPRAAKFLEERYYEQLPPGYIPMGATGELGQAELEAIKQIMESEK